MKNTSLFFVVLSVASLFACVASADLAMDFREGRGSANPDGPSDLPTVLAAFQGADANLDGSTTTVVWAGDTPINGGNSGNNGTTWNDLATAQTFGAYTVQTTGSVGGFSAGSASWNDMAAISETYAFENGATDVNTLTVSGFSTNAGDILTLTVWGIGDNLSQDSRITSHYSVAADQTAETLYNGGGPRNDSTGSIPWVQFSYVSDGTDSISFDWEQSDNGGTGAFNGFSLSITPIPEPAGGVICLAFAGAGFIRRRVR
ncbi:MAG: hypothetical protein AAF456_07175 [Planctomycetota bacterium]